MAGRKDAERRAENLHFRNGGSFRVHAHASAERRRQHFGDNAARRAGTVNPAEETRVRVARPIGQYQLR